MVTWILRIFCLNNIQMEITNLSIVAILICIPTCNIYPTLQHIIILIYNKIITLYKYIKMGLLIVIFFSIIIVITVWILTRDGFDFMALSLCLSNNINQIK